MPADDTSLKPSSFAATPAEAYAGWEPESRSRNRHGPRPRLLGLGHRGHPVPRHDLLQRRRPIWYQPPGYYAGRSNGNR